MVEAVGNGYINNFNTFLLAGKLPEEFSKP
jgi:hypothetical protein